MRGVPRPLARRPVLFALLRLAADAYGATIRGEIEQAVAEVFAEQGFVLDQGDVDLLNEATEDFRKDAPSAAISGRWVCRSSASARSPSRWRST